MFTLFRSNPVCYSTPDHPLHMYVQYLRFFHALVSYYTQFTIQPGLCSNLKPYVSCYHWAFCYIVSPCLGLLKESVQWLLLLDNSYTSSVSGLALRDETGGLVSNPSWTLNLFFFFLFLPLSFREKFLDRCESEIPSPKHATCKVRDFLDCPTKMFFSFPVTSSVGTNPHTQVEGQVSQTTLSLHLDRHHMKVKQMTRSFWLRQLLSTPSLARQASNPSQV